MRGIAGLGASQELAEKRRADFSVLVFTAASLTFVLSPILVFTSSLMMPSALPGRTVPADRLDRLRCWQLRRVTQIPGEHHDKGRNDAESEKCVQRWQNGA